METALINKILKGDTLYVTFKNIYHLAKPFEEWVNIGTTVLVPSNVKVEVNGNHHDLDVNARNISHDWIIKQAAHVNISIDKTSDLKISTDSKDIIDNENTEFGKGTHSIFIHQPDNVKVEEF